MGKGYLGVQQMSGLQQMPFPRVPVTHSLPLCAQQQPVFLSLVAFIFFNFLLGVGGHVDYRLVVLKGYTYSQLRS